MAKKDKRKKSTIEKQARNRRKAELYKARSEGPAFYSQSETPEQREERLARLGVDITRVDVQGVPQKPVTEEKRVAQVPQVSNSKLSLKEQVARLEFLIEEAYANVVPLPEGTEDRLIPVTQVHVGDGKMVDLKVDVLHNEMVMEHRFSMATVKRLERVLDGLNGQYYEQHSDKFRISAKEFERREHGIKKQHGGSARDNPNLVNPYGRSRDTSWW